MYFKLVYVKNEGDEWLSALESVDIDQLYNCLRDSKTPESIARILKLKSCPYSIKLLNTDINRLMWSWNVVNGLVIRRTPSKSKQATKTGMKFDDGKLDYTLLPWKALEEVVKVLEAGEKKYARDNWQQVDDGVFRYTKAAFRHLIAYSKGELTDPETGLHHLAHCVCCLLFIMSFNANK